MSWEIPSSELVGEARQLGMGKTGSSGDLEWKNHRKIEDDRMLERFFEDGEFFLN